MVGMSILSSLYNKRDCARRRIENSRTRGEGMELGIASVAAITAVAYLIGMAVGIASGWAATGVHQSVKQLTKQT